MTAKDLVLESGEKIIDTWPLLYTPPAGGNYDVRCTITNKRIMCVHGGEMEMTPELKNLAEAREGDREWLVIPKDRIRHLGTKRSYLEKRVIITLDNGQCHEFSYRALNIDRLVAAIGSTEKNSIT